MPASADATDERRNSVPLGATTQEGHLGRAYARFLDLLAATAGIMIIFAMLSVTADVVLRFAFGRGLVWSFEVTEFLLLYIPMLTLPWLARQRAHIQIDVVISRLPHAAAARLDILACALVAAICIFITYWSTIATLDAYERGIENAGLVAWPRWALLVSIPPAFALTALEFLRIAGIRLREIRKGGVE